MNHKIILFLIICSFSCICVEAQKVKNDKKQESWIDACVKERARICTALQKANMPVESEWMKSKMKAAPFIVNLKGVDKLLLMVSGGPDGSSWDHAVWGNARFIKADGSSVWMDEIKPEYAKTGSGEIKLNKNMNDKELRIAGKAYERGVFCHGDGMLYYSVDKFVRFEAEVGIDDGSHIGSVYFRAYNAFPQESIKKLADQYVVELGQLKSDIPDFNFWFLSPDDSVEKQLVTNISNWMKDGTYFKNKIKSIGEEKDMFTRIRRYLELYEQEYAVLRLQNQLLWLDMESIQLALADMKKQNNFDASKYEPLYNELLDLVKKGFDGIYSLDQQAMDNVKKAMSIKRTILLGNPLLDIDKIIVTRFALKENVLTAMAPDLGTQSNNWSNQQSARRFDFDADIVELSNIRGEVKVRSVYKPENGASIADLKLHWDANRIMFSSVMPDKRWNIFETTINGTGAKPLVNTVEPDLEFFDGSYLPDGRILTTANIGYQGVPCVSGGDPVGNFMLYDPQKQSLRRLTFDQDANWNPVIMHNGRIMYTRWEYTDLTHYYSRIVMHMNPDGTENKALFGSGSMFPNSTFDMQPLPGHASAFIGIISGHHGTARSGRLIMFDPSLARTGVKGMTHEIPHRKRPIVELIKDGLVDDVWPQFIKPYPLDDKYFLVTAKLDWKGLWGVYLVDVFDNVTLVAEFQGQGLISPIPVRKSTIPPSIPDRVKLGDKEATIFIQDIYEGEGLRGVPRGTVKALRVLSYEYAYIYSPSDFCAQGIQSGWDIKRLLGTVSVEEDGSVIFKIPANMPVSLQPLDSEGRAIQWMRSWFTGMPGEIVSCVGCHEDQNKIAIPKRVIASTKAPSKLTKQNGHVRSFTFDYEIQPILDRACVSCHNGHNGKMDLRGGKKDPDTGYGISYLAIHPYINRQGPEADMPVLAPYEYHASTSELVRLLKNGHCNVKLTDAEWRTLYNWIDFNAPDKGRFTANSLNGTDQISRRQELGKKYADGVFVDWQGELAEYAAYLKSQGEIKPEMPEPLKKTDEKEIKVKGWPFDSNRIKDMLSKEKETRKEITVAPGVAMKFVRIPAGEFVMGSYQGSLNNKPESHVKIEKSFWMGEVEVTNQQFCSLFPEHDSRYIDQFWKDHTTPGYPANEPIQPVIRVSWEEAMMYCRKLREQTGFNITLPTEAQWEWACRAGTSDAFWYGDMNTDFSTKENLADSQLTKMAVSGINPQPMSKDDFWYKYFNFVPKAESVDDGSMFQTDAHKYESNPFNLYAMHGNVEEWTRSDYRPYPYIEKSNQPSEFKVVRGGSYWERPKYSTSYTRKYFYPWQKVKNVGFRVIIED